MVNSLSFEGENVLHSNYTYIQLLAAMTPYSRDYSGHPKIACTDTPQQISNYRKKLSGPLLDRFDLHVEVAFQSGAVLLGKSAPAESSSVVYQRVVQARQRQSESV